VSKAAHAGVFGSELDLRRQLDLACVVGLENTTEVRGVRDAARKNERRCVECVEELETYFQRSRLSEVRAFAQGHIEVAAAGSGQNISTGITESSARRNLERFRRNQCSTVRSLRQHGIADSVQPIFDWSVWLLSPLIVG
jgi:hypothetical protein